MHIGQAGLGGEVARAFDMGRIEIEPPHFRLRAGRGHRDRGKAVRAAEIGIAERFGQIGRAVPKQQRGGGEPVWRRFPIEVARVDNICNTNPLKESPIHGYQSR